MAAESHTTNERTTPLDDVVRAFTASPDDAALFKSLTERLTQEGDWSTLADLYQLRADAPSLRDDQPARVQMMLRRAQVLEERCFQPERALEIYSTVARIEPENLVALRQMRAIHASRDQWDMVIQIAELEGRIAMEPYEEARYHAELGIIWAQVGDDVAAERSFGRSLEIDEHQLDGLAGLGRLLMRTGRHTEAVALYERLVKIQRGPDRAVALVELGECLAGPLEMFERATECFRRALTEDPRCQAAVEALAGEAERCEQWDLLADLCERRFDLAAGARVRTSIALQAATIQSERLDNPLVARMWFRRAVELCDDDPAVHAGLADLERRVGNEEGLRTALDRVIDLSPQVSTALLIEASELNAKAGRKERALAQLERAFADDPDDPRVLEAFSSALDGTESPERLAQRIDVLERRASHPDEKLDARASILSQVAALHRSAHDEDAATQTLERAFALDPCVPGAAETLEAHYRKLEDTEALRFLFETVAECGPEDQRARAACELGQLCVEAGDDEAAQQAFERARQLDPDDPRVLAGLVSVARTRGDAEHLTDSLIQLAEAARDADDLQPLIAELVPLLEEQDRQPEAIDWLERLLVALPENRSTLNTLARLHRELGEEDALAGVLVRIDALSEGSESADVRIELGRVHERLGEDEEAESWFERALEADPGRRDVLGILIERDRREQRWERLADRLNQLAQQQREAGDEVAHFATLRELSGILEEQLGDTSRAIDVLTALAGDPDFDEPSHDRLHALLERAGRFDDLLEQLERRASLSHDPSQARDLQLRRADLLRERLGRFDDASTLYRAIVSEHPEFEPAREGLEASLREGQDFAGLAELIGNRAESCTDDATRGQLKLEQAELIERAGDGARSALTIYRELSDPRQRTRYARVAAEARQRLLGALEREGDWEGVRERLKDELGFVEDSAQTFELHERLAVLCRDRIGDHSGAIDHLEAAVAVFPTESPMPWRRLAELYEECDEPQNLLRALAGELATSPERSREVELRIRAGRLCANDLADPSGVCEHFERVLELDASNVEAFDFLAERYEARGDSEALRSVLSRRLEDLVAAGSGEDVRDKRTTLRLRLAALDDATRDGAERAIALLEAAEADAGCQPRVAQALFERLEQRGDARAIAELCTRVVPRAGDEAHRREWQLRRAHALREAGDAAAAAEAFRSLVEDGAGDESAAETLCQLYRELDDAERLAALLQQGIAAGRFSPAEELERRSELASLLSDRLERPEDALDHWMAVSRQAPDRRDALAAALALAELLGRAELAVELIEGKLAASPSRHERADLEERRGRWLAESLGRKADAIEAYRAALEARPERTETRSALRLLLEEQGDWSGALEQIGVEAATVSAARRAELFDHAATIAAREIGSDASLPWLERRRDLNPEDREIHARIAEVHRSAGRPGAVLRSIDAQLEFAADLGTQRDLHVDRARVYERDLGSPARATEALEAARGVAPNDTAVLRELDRLYGECNRSREQFEIIEARLKTSRGADAIVLHRRAADLAAGSLAKPEAALRHRKAALKLTSDETEQAPLLEALQEAQLAASDVRGAADTAARRLALLDERHPDRTRLRLDLARLLDDKLGDEEATLEHLRVLLDDVSIDDYQRDFIEDRVIAKLRRRGEWIELDERLYVSLERRPERPEIWLELARLRDEVLCSPAAAAAAAEEAVRLAPENLDALRTFRSLSERLGDWEAAVRTLELELEAGREGPNTLPAGERAALQQRLGTLLWRRLGRLEAARTALEAALETEGGNDLGTLRSLQDLCERLGEHERALDYAERECERIGDEESDRARSVWLRAGGLARHHLDDPERAIAAYERAAELGPLGCDDARALAELYERTGNEAAFAERFGAWIDRDDTQASADDLLRLAAALRSGGRTAEATTRTRQACELDHGNRKSWEQLAELEQSAGNGYRAGEAIERAASLTIGTQAASLWLRAARLREADDATAALQCVRRAVEQNPSSAEAHAERARLADAAGEADEAQEAAGACLDLSKQGSEVDRNLELAAALAGGRAARRRNRQRAALLFYGSALELEPEHPEALREQADLLLESEDFENARPLIEKRLELSDDYPDRARHIAMLGVALERGGELEASLTRFREARDEDANSSLALGGVARVLEALGRNEEAADACESWARSDVPGEERNAAWLRAAALHRRGERPARAEAALRGAIEHDAACHAASTQLAEQLCDEERYAEAVEVVETARAQEPGTDFGARLSAVAAQSHEALGDSDRALEAHRSVTELDPWNVASAHAFARLARASGEFAQAAEQLGKFIAAHPQPGAEVLGAVFAERARLLSGPLERIDEAIEAYRAALEREPGNTEWQERLAGLLGHVPQRWREAASLHREILFERPTATASIRALAKIASFRGRPELAERGTGLLEVLGAAAPGEHSGEPLRGSEPTRRRVLDDPIGEAIREAVQDVQDDLRSVGALPPASSSPDEGPTAGDQDRDAAEFRRAVYRAADELAAPGLLRMEPERLYALFVSLACAGSEQRDARADAALVERLSESLGRRARKRLRRLVDEIGFEKITSCDADYWRTELAAAAAENALCDGNFEARTAVLALCDGSPELARSENPDVSALVEGSPAARGLFARLVARWCRATGSL